MQNRELYYLTKKEKNTKARLGELRLAHGVVQTPVFMPVGTIGTVKTMSSIEMAKIGYELILNNTLHLFLRPGLDIIKEFKGIKNMIRWNKNLLTDSGGYQVFSLSDFRHINDDGVIFKDPMTGSKHFFNPEIVIDIQKIIGSDIIMPLDECTPTSVDKSYSKIAKDRTTRWAKRSRDYIKTIEDPPFLFGITQGNMYEDLRKESILELVDLDFDGYSIGGLSVGENKEIMYSITDISTAILPENKARYLMGVGSPEDLVETVGLGIDMFDCVMPTRNARNGSVFTHFGKMNLINAKHKTSQLPIEEGCPCFACQNYSRGYIRHLFKTREMLGYQLATVHNLTYIFNLMKEIRKAIEEDRYPMFKKKFYELYFHKE